MTEDELREARGRDHGENERCVLEVSQISERQQRYDKERA